MGITYNELDSQLDRYIEAACTIVEDMTGASTRTLTWCLYQDYLEIGNITEGCFIDLPYQPVASVTSVKYWYQNTLLTATTGDTSPYNYRLLARNQIQWIVIPRIDYRPDAIQYTYTQGPWKHTNLIKLAILNVAASLFENKEDGIINVNSGSYSWLDRILSPLRRYYV